MHPPTGVTPRQLCPGDRVRVRGQRWQVARYLPYGTTGIIEVRGCDVSNRGERARFLLPFELLDRLGRWRTPRVVSPARWRHAARAALADAAPRHASSLRAAARTNLDLIPFQLEPALAFVRGDGCRFLIADAVGMGKTIQAGLMIAESLHRRPDGRVLIVAPAGLREQWRDELRARFALSAEILDTAGIARVQARVPTGVNPWAIHPLAIASIDYVKRPEVLRCHEPLLWDLVIFDEAHALAGRSDRAAAADALGRRARTLVMLTATPHSGDEDAFRRMCRIGQLKDDGPLLLFRRTRADTGMTASRRSVMLRVRPTSAESAMHGALTEYARLVWAQASGVAAPGARLAMSVLTRRASSSAASLARSVQRRLALLGSRTPEPGIQALLPFTAAEDEEPEALLGAPGLPDTRDERDHLERVLRLAHEAMENESKLAALFRLLARSRESAIVFTEYRDTLQQLVDKVASRVGDAVLLHGALTLRERTEALHRFTSGGARLLLATDAASEGLNLHHRCRVVINLELPWTPLRLEQRAGRIDRIGQQRKVHAVHLVASGTCEETVLAKLAERMFRAQRGMEVFGRLPDERDIADAVFADRLLRDPDVRAPSSSASLEGTRIVDLRCEAKAEAVRLATARTLIDPPGNPVFDTRPVITRIRRRRDRVGAPRCYWLFRILVAAADGRLVWDAAVPIVATASPMPGRSRASTRLLLDPCHPTIQRFTSDAAKACANAVRLLAREQAGVFLRRERALIDDLSERRARLSAGLLQLGLFDHRHERLAAAQAALLEQALSVSRGRVAELAAYEHLQLDSCDLVFAVAVDGAPAAPDAVDCR